MGWITLLKLFVSLAYEIAKVVNQRQLMGAGAAQEALGALEKANEAIARGQKARMDARADLERNPDSVHDDDGFKRPD